MKKFLLLVTIAIVLAYLTQQNLYGSKINIDFRKATTQSLREAANLCQQVAFIPTQAKCLASVLQDQTYCEKIFWPPAKNMCFALATLDESYCEKLSLYARKKCFDQLAELTKTPYLCDYGSLYPNDCYLEYAVGYKKSEYCSKISEIKEARMDVCRAFAERNLSRCTIINSGDEKAFCEAVLSKNTDICEKLDEDYRDDCYTKIATSKMDKYLCEMIETKKNMARCLIKVAAYTKDPEICESLGIFDKDRCYFELAKVMGESLNLYTPAGT